MHLNPSPVLVRAASPTPPAPRKRSMLGSISKSMAITAGGERGRFLSACQRSWMGQVAVATGWMQG